MVCFSSSLSQHGCLWRGARPVCTGRGPGLAVPAAGCLPRLPVAGRAELQAGLVSNHSEGLVALETKYPRLGSLYLSLLEQAPGAPKKHQTEASPATTHCTCKTLRVNDSSQGLFKACGFKTGACLVGTDGLLLCALAGHALGAAWSMAQTRNVLPKVRHLRMRIRCASSRYDHSLSLL